MSQVDRIQVLVIDDSSLVRLGFQQVLAAQDDFVVVGLAADWREGMQIFQDTTPDMIVMDLHWPSSETLEALRTFKDTRPEVRVLVLLGSSDPSAAVAAIGNGADALVHSAVEPETLVTVLRLLRRGDSFVIHHRVWKRVARMLNGGAPLGPGGQLSVREQEVLALLADGRTDREIAQSLTISEPTAKHHVAHILHKLNVSTRTAAAKLARDNRGYIRLAPRPANAVGAEGDPPPTKPDRSASARRGDPSKTTRPPTRP